MADIRLTIPNSIVEALQAKLGPEFKATDMARDAMTLFNWAVNERAKGRKILSADDEGAALKEVVMPSLESVKQS